MLGRVARTLLDSPSIGRIVVLAQEAEALLTGELAWMAAEPRIATAEAGDGISASVGRLAGTEAAPYPVLVTTADHPLLRPEMVETFIAGADGRRTRPSRWSSARPSSRSIPTPGGPGSRRPNGHYSGANLFALHDPGLDAGTEFWARAEKDRKRTAEAAQLSSASGYSFAPSPAPSRSRPPPNGPGRKAGFRLKAVLLPFAEAAIDVDKPADLELAERILAARATSPAAAAAAAAAAAGRAAAP